MPDSPRTNRLADETSPYLRQHAHNPVDWYPWGAEALDRARREDKPIFLSIGYSACHWCHVMERESFESETVAALLNEAFVSIKVDREERPDLDDIYMAAVVAMTGQGGWPMTVFLTPDLEPFYGGTYFPPTDALGRPGFTTVLRAVEDAWQNKRDEVLRGAAGLTSHVRQQMTAEVAPGPVTAALLDAAADQLRDSFDGADGGWGGAPKFPSGATIGLLLRQYARTGDEDLLRMATYTLDRMAMGGLHDHVGGGFHRYSVDGQWLVPHFEKMLYDNAQLSLAYLEAFQLTGEERYADVVRDTLDYELRDMRDALGGFHSAEDADSEGEEGKFYLWTASEVDTVLGLEDAALFREAYQLRPEGNFPSHEPYHGGQNIPHRAAPADPALEARLAPMRAKLLDARATRTRPGLDDKVLTSWNALIIASLARASRVLGEGRYRRAAEEAGRFLLDHMVRDGVLLRTHRQGESRLEGYLDDYAFAVNAFVDLYEATFDAAWLREADALARGMTDRFWDEERGVFYFTAPAQADLIVRARPTFDNAEPSGNSVAAHALLRLGRLLGRADYETQARRVLEANAALMARAPQGFSRMLWAVDFLLHPGGEVVVAGPPDHPETRAFLDTVHRHFLPNTVTALADPGAPGDADISLLEGKGLVNGRPAVYVCRDYTCERPVTDAADLEARLVDMTLRSG